MGGTQIWLKEGEQLTLDEMLKAIAVGSANDCAVAVAEHLAGSEAAFVEQMNARAKELGCTGTTFVNANGLDTDGQKTLTTAHDLALISVELLRHPKIIDYTSIWMDTIRNGAFGLANTNKMLRKYDGMIVSRPGISPRAGFLHLGSRRAGRSDLDCRSHGCARQGCAHGRCQSTAQLWLCKLCRLHARRLGGLRGFGRSCWENSRR